MIQSAAAETTAHPYASAVEHLQDELALVAMFAERALARGRAEGWISGESETVGADADEIRALFVQIEQRLAASRAAGRRPPMDLLRDHLGLTLAEQRVLWTLVGYEVDPRVRLLLRRVGPDDRRGVSVATLLSLLYAPYDTATGLDDLGSLGSLVALRLVDAIETNGAGIGDRVLRVADRVVEAAHGILRLDVALDPMARLIVEPPGLDDLVLAESTVSEAVALVRHAVEAEDAPPVVLVVGPEGSGRKSLVLGAAAACHLPVLAVRCRDLPLDAGKLDAAVRAIAREAAVFGALLLLEDVDLLAADAEGGRPDRLTTVDRACLSRLVAPVAGTCHEPPRGIARGVSVLELRLPTEAQRRELWQRELGDAPAHLLDAAAARYPVTGGVIAHAAGVLRARSRHGGLGADDLHEALRGLVDTRLGGLGSRVTVSQSWADLVLPEDTHDEVREMLARVTNRHKVLVEWGFARHARGLGLAALFSGAPGTGKTMVAGLIARELGLDLYRVDLSRIVSKWVGETEKNLSTVFAAAEAGHAVLLFDEADSLFAKRTEVKSSMDRYANLEINYLLQRMEDFAGITILTTNHAASIDDAFARRLSFRITFPDPEPEERLRLWQVHVPPEAALAGDVDLERLAERYKFTGGYIRNVALRAAFFAAAEAAPISMEHFIRAARLEESAMGKVTR